MTGTIACAHDIVAVHGYVRNPGTSAGLLQCCHGAFFFVLREPLRPHEEWVTKPTCRPTLFFVAICILVRRMHAPISGIVYRIKKITAREWSVPPEVAPKCIYILSSTHPIGGGRSFCSVCGETINKHLILARPNVDTGSANHVRNCEEADAA